MRVEESLRATRGPPTLVAAIPAMVAAVSVIVLIDVKRRWFQLSRCSPIFLCISTLSATASMIAWSLAITIGSETLLTEGKVPLVLGSYFFSKLLVVAATRPTPMPITSCSTKSLAGRVKDRRPGWSLGILMVALVIPLRQRDEE
ncbi:hypothetical protein PVL29_012403 [Vitis rotundifolia]|uniref:Uncharacterized protein n=1 Tax=Vitis rotundifolia TaxID=103349 RepID=A0AA39DLZ4_VITRO|nr:hypothetical protein PVL29_012403 [Vitis rotundifolia]